MWGLEYCDEVRGLHGSLPGELLHVFQQGLFKYLRTAILQQKCIQKQTKRVSQKEQQLTKSDKRKKKRTHGYDPHVQYQQANPSVEDTTQQHEPETEITDPVQLRIHRLEQRFIQNVDKSFMDNLFSEGACFYQFLPDKGYANTHKNFVFGSSDDSKKKLIRHSRLYGSMLVHQSDREFHHAYFSSGIATDASVNGHEERCILLLFLIIFCSKWSIDYINTAMSEARVSLFNLVLSHSLMIESYLRLDSAPKKVATSFKIYIPIYQALFKECIQCLEGDRTDLIKYHILVHLGHDILRFGPATCVDASYGEAHHMEKKEYGRRTQKNPHTFDAQTASHESDAIILHRAQAEINRQYPTRQTHDDDEIFSRGENYIFTENGFFLKPKKASQFDNPPDAVSFHNTRLQIHLSKFLIDNVLPLTDCYYLMIPCLCNVGDMIYRADPCATTKYHRGRHDWVNIAWSRRDGGLMPARIYCFFFN